MVVDVEVWRRDDEDAVGTKNTATLVQELLLLKDVFEGLVADDDIDAFIVQGNIGAETSVKREVVSAVSSRGVGDDIVRRIDAEHAPRLLRDHPGAVPCSTRNVQHVLGFRKQTRKLVAVDVFQSGDVHVRGGETFGVVRAKSGCHLSE